MLRLHRLYHKNQFTYDAEQDVYSCPAGQHLQRISHIQKSARSREHWVYACDTCAACPQRTACTRSARGRRIKRYPEDEVRLALQAVMTHLNAQAVNNRGCLVFGAEGWWASNVSLPYML